MVGYVTGPEVVMVYLSIGICDDERQICELLREKIVNYSISKNIECEIKSYENGESLLENWPEKLDIIFLDVEMPGKNGLEIAREIRRRNKTTIIIFLTAYREFVFESFKVDAFRYLLKPLKDQEFDEAMDAILKNLYQEEETLKIQFHGEKYTIRIDDIIYIEVMNKKIWIYCSDQTYRWVGSLNELTDRIRDKGFFRIHRSYLINMNKIKYYNNQIVHLEQGYELQISRYKLNEFKEEYIKFWSKVL